MYYGGVTTDFDPVTADSPLIRYPFASEPRLSALVPAISFVPPHSLFPSLRFVWLEATPLSLILCG